MSLWYSVRRRIEKLLRLDPTHSQQHYASRLQAVVARGDRWLDVGCGRQIVPDWALAPTAQAELAKRARLFIGMDVDSAIREHPLLDAPVIAFIEGLPFRSGSLDVISANVVFEHLEQPLPAFRELRRALRPGGRLVFLTPNAHYYLVAVARLVPDGLKKRIVGLLEKRAEADVFPTFYRVNTATRIRELAGQAGFEVESLRHVGSGGSFRTLGPLAWVECFALKLVANLAGGRFNVALLATLRRTAEPDRDPAA